MGRTPQARFSKANSNDATSRHDTDGGTWPWTMCLHISKKKSKPLAELLGTKQSCKSSYTILKGSLDEKHGECVKIKINASLSKTRSIFLWKSSIKGGRSTLANGWRWGRAAMVLAHGVAWVLGVYTCIAQTYFTTWTNAHAWHNHVGGGGVGSCAIFENLWEANACVFFL